MSKLSKASLWGTLSSFGIFAAYFGIVSLLSGVSFAKKEFLGDWYWILLLSIGFGAQVALYRFLKDSHLEKVSAKSVVATGGLSGASMLLCCSHYLVNILPFAGVAGASILATSFQEELFLVSLILNAIGVLYLLNKLWKEKQK